MRHSSRCIFSERSSFASRGRSHANESSREAWRQFRSSSASMDGLAPEPVALEAAAQRDARAMQDHPAVGGGDALVLADDRRVLAQHLALEEHAARRGRQSREAHLECLPEPALLERGLRVVPRLRRAPPVAGLVEHVVKPRLLVLDEAVAVEGPFRPLRDKAALEVAPLYTQDG